jgi:hypothetical protein
MTRLTRSALFRALQHKAALALLLASVVPPCLHAQEPGIYTCTDAKGRKLTSDRPIAECRDREQKILNPSGTVKAKIGPTLTAQELSQLEAQNKAELAEQARLVEEKRRDRALLIRYPNPGVHEKERAEALANIAHVKQTAADRVTQLQADRTKLTGELAFYKKDPSKTPARLQRQLDELDQSLAAQERFIADQDKEIDRTNARFDNEAVRLTPLWRMASVKTQ